jgi:diaminohydroxyphosphoribosylaminopyrimidine deaminase/5-amino-6-(5-phosphoribosylamino)uracil reductase
MTSILGEDQAWDLIREIPSERLGSLPLRVDLPGSPGMWLEVDPSGSWTASHPLSPDAIDVVDLYLPLQLTGTLTIDQLGQSLDGRIATETGASHFITGPEDRKRLHRLRALVDAVVVGANTVEFDDPRLSVRAVEGDDPVRVVLDPRGRLDQTRRVFTDGGARTIVVRSLAGRGTEADAVAEGSVATDTLWIEATEDGLFEARVILDALRAEGYRRVLVEGGGLTVSRFLQAQLLDRLHVTVAPLLIGSGRPSLILEPILSLDEALRPPCRQFRMGEDVLFDLDVRSP